MKEVPACEAYAAAWAWTPGSRVACWRRTECRMVRKGGFSWNVEGVGGIVDVRPMERFGFGGFVGRYVRSLRDGLDGSEK